MAQWFDSSVGAIAMVTLLGVAACAEPECPDNYFKDGKVCRRIDAGAGSDGGVGDGGLEAGRDPVLVGSDGAVSRGDATVSGGDARVGDGAASVLPEASTGVTGMEAGTAADAAQGVDAAMDGGGTGPLTDTGVVIDAGAAVEASTRDAGPDAVVSCSPGYVLKNGACQDVDECFEGTHECHMTATCSNTAGAYDCTCPLGYSGGTSAGFACAPRIAVGSDHACVLLTNGTVQCWGQNTYGQLGDGTQTDRGPPVPVNGLADVVAINGGLNSTCALLRDRTLRCWGANTEGMLGDGTTMNRSTPAAVLKLDTVVAVDAYAGHACAVLRNGTVKCWGANGDGQLGTGVASAEPTLTPIGVVGIGDATQVFVGSKETCAVLRTGATKCWGNELLGTPARSSSLVPVDLPVPRNVKSMALGIFHACSVHTDGSVYCWGPEPLGGNATSGGDETPKSVLGVRATAVGTGGYSTVVLQQDATIAWWDTARTPAVLGGVTGAIAIGSALKQVCQLLQNGTVSCWTINNGSITAPIVVSGLDLW